MKTRKAVNKRLAILQAAAKMFATKGYSQTTLADIGAEAGTFAGSLYYYFPSKENIVEEVLNVGTTSVSNLVLARISTMPAEASVHDKIKMALSVHLEQMLENNEFVVAYWNIIGQVPEDIRRQHLLLPREYGRFWNRLLLEGQANGEIRADLDASLIRLLLVGSTIYALQWYKPDGRYTPAEIAGVLTEMFFNGVLAKKQTARASKSPARRQPSLSEASEPVEKSKPVKRKTIKKLASAKA